MQFVAMGSSIMRREAHGCSAMYVPIIPMNLVETGSAEDVIESGTQEDNIVETGDA